MYKVILQDGVREELLVRLVIYLALLLGVWLLTSPWVKGLISKRGHPLKQKKQSPFYKHLIKVAAVLPGDSLLWADGVLMLTIFLITTVLIFIRQINIGVILLALFVGAIPYGILRIILIFKRIETSHEGESMVGEILKQYKLTGFNMQQAIDMAMSSLNHCPNSKRLLYKLSSGLMTYRGEEELRYILDTFTYAVDTRWMKLLSNNIHLAIMDGRNVTAGLTDILKELQQAKKEREEANRLNLDGFLIALIFTPLAYIASIIGASKYFDVSIQQFFYNQLRGTGLKIFISMILLAIVNGVIIFFQNYRKLDYK